MPYQNSTTSVSENDLLHLLVAQVSRAFFDPPYIILLDKMMAKDMFHPGELAREVGVDVQSVKRFLPRLVEQRMIRQFENYERPSATGNPYAAAKLRKNPYQKRWYYYIDYHDFINVVKYRLAAMRQAIEQDVKKETTRKDYACPHCHREYTALDVAYLASGTSSSGSFELQCEDCGAPIDSKLNDEEKTREGEKMQRFNERMGGVRRTLMKLERVEFKPINPLSYLLQNVPETLNVTYDTTGKQIISDAPRDLEGAEGAEVVVVRVDGEGEEGRRREGRVREGDAQRQQNVLPDWHTHSTITGEVTALGKAHLARQASSHAGPSSAAGEEKKGSAIDADLAAHYAKLEAEARAIPWQGQGLKQEEVDVEMDDVDGEGEGDEEALAAVRKTLVSVGGVMKPFDEVEEDDHAEMTDEEYLAYAKLDEEIQGLVG